MEQFALALEKIDAANAADPKRIPYEGKEIPGEVLYGRRMSAWLERLYPEASPALRLAARAQHIRRWEVPRDQYPTGRTGYLRWRTALYAFHAEAAAEILSEIGYDPETTQRVRYLIQKKNLTRDAETQALEDVVCLVFLEFYFADFSERHPAEKVIDIVRKTWRKMSEIARTAALTLPLQPPARGLVERALSESP